MNRMKEGKQQNSNNLLITLHVHISLSLILEHDQWHIITIDTLTLVRMIHIRLTRNQWGVSITSILNVSNTTISCHSLCFLAIRPLIRLPSFTFMTAVIFHSHWNKWLSTMSSHLQISLTEVTVTWESSDHT